MSEIRSFRLARGAESPRAWLALVPLATVLVALALVFGVFLRPGRVDGDSMLPTLLPEDRFLSTPSYDAPHRGDIVVFDTKDNADNTVRLVKRVVAIAGDTVTVEGDVVVVNGRELFDSRIDSGRRIPVEGPFTVPAGHVFVLGDNRPVALDSRQFGPVPVYSIHGKVVALFWPPSRARLVR